MRATVAAVLLGAALAGAEPGPAMAGRDTPVPAACKLLERSEIAEVLGVEAGRGRKGGVGPTCLWKVARGSAEGGGEIGALLERGRSARRSFRIARSFAEDELAIDDLGRDAFFALDTVYVLVTKRTLIYVQGVFTDTSTVDVTALEANLVDLARIAAERAR